VILSIPAGQTNNLRVEVKVFNLKGELILSKLDTLNNPSPTVSLELNTQNLANGVYVVRVKTTGDQGTRDYQKKIAIIKKK
jgi:hypothetical protein